MVPLSMDDFLSVEHCTPGARPFHWGTPVRDGREAAIGCDFHLRLAGFRRFVWRCQVMPMTRVDRAASTTSSVMVLSSLICMMRSICVNSLSMRRKLPRVIRAIAARA